MGSRADVVEIARERPGFDRRQKLFVGLSNQAGGDEAVAFGFEVVAQVARRFLDPFPERGILGRIVMGLVAQVQLRERLGQYCVVGLQNVRRVALAAAYHFAEADFQRAEIHYDKALELNPNDYWGYCLKGWLFALSGETERARACLAEAIRLSPVDTYDCRIAVFLSAYSARRYDEALSALGSIAEPTNLVNALLAMCYGQLGRDTEAGRAMADYLARARDEIVDYPGADRDLWRSYWGRIFPFKDDADLDHLLEGFLETAFH